MKPLLTTLAGMLLAFYTNAQGPTATLSGHISGKGEPLPGAAVLVLHTSTGAVADNEGHFILKDILPGEHLLRISYVGFRTLDQKIVLSPGENRHMDFTLQEDVLGLEAVVVSATRNTTPAHIAPVMVHRIDDRIFERTQSLSLSEGLNFSPGLRLENNCQNCGFTQLRMNGLGGAYSQILINSRPVFSALAGVYGLEMIPANMVDRIEVVRGGGSALFGGNAIAGTVNIITKEPLFNALEAGLNYALTHLEQPDRTLSLNGALVSDDMRYGASFFAYNRDRAPWDANADGFSELTQLRNTTFGADVFFQPNAWNKIKLNVFSMGELRRGGNAFERPPHQADVAEQLQHDILGGGLSWERFSKDFKRKLSLYTSLQNTGRDSYYGGGGRILQPGDALTEQDILAINAYGRSSDLALAAGMQYSADLGAAWSLTAGSEYQRNAVEDLMPGYGRRIEQEVNVWGNYVQLQWKPGEKWSFLGGGRFDLFHTEGVFDLAADRLSNRRTLPVFVPRISVMHFLEPELKLRLSWAQGYRAPQAFDEDLHIQTVGGAAVFTRLSPELRTERSQSLSASLDYTLRQGSIETNFIADAFYTRLQNPFITAEQQELPNGTAVLTKRNGTGAAVAGINMEVNSALGPKWFVQIGGTLQSARYVEDEIIWSPVELSEANRDSIVCTRHLLRTPRAYGFFTTNWKPSKRLDVFLSGVFTGPMDVPHVIDPGTEYTIIRRTPAFIEINPKIAWKMPVAGNLEWEWHAGVQNLLQSYQRDFDFGAARDAGYVYGPTRPRTVYAGMKIRL